MSQHFGFGGCQGTEGEIAHAINIPKNTASVNSITESQYTTFSSVWAFVLNPSMDVHSAKIKQGRLV